MFFKSIGYKKLLWFSLICVVTGSIFTAFYEPIVEEGKDMRRVGWVYELVDNYLGRLGIALVLIGGGIIIGLRGWLGIQNEKKNRNKSS